MSQIHFFLSRIHKSIVFYGYLTERSHKTHFFLTKISLNMIFYCSYQIEICESQNITVCNY